MKSFLLKPCLKVLSTVLICLTLLSSVVSTSVLAVDNTNYVNYEVAPSEPTNVVYDMNSFNDMLISFDSEAFGKMKWELPNEIDKLGLLNIEYNILSNKMDSIGYGNEYSLQAPKFDNGYSGNVIAMFNDTFGNTQNTLSNYQIPEGWSVNNIMSVAQNNRIEVLGDYKNSESYKQISDTINTSSIFKEASKTMTMPQSMSIQSCAQQLSSISNPYSLDKNSFITNGNKYNSDTNYYEEYSNYCNEMKLWQIGQDKAKNPNRDIDGDGEITDTDGQILQDRSENYFKIFGEQLSDYDGDGKITIKDKTLMNAMDSIE